MTDIVVFGLRAVTAAIAAGRRPVKRVWLAAGRRADRATAELLRLAATRRIPVERVSRRELEQRAGSPSHQGVAATAGPLVVPELELALAAQGGAERLIVVLDGVQDPHNLGAVVRTAAAAGASAVVVPRDRTTGLTPTAVKVAAGAAEQVPVVPVANLARALKMIRAAGYWIYGLDAGADRCLFAAELTGAVALVLGGEGRGLRRLTRDGCDHLVAIPTAAGAAVNLAVAAGVAMFEVVRQRLRER